MKIKTAELSGRALDWAVANAVGGKILTLDGKVAAIRVGSSQFVVVLPGDASNYHPSTDWSQCGALIEAEDIEFKWVSDATLEAHSYLHDPHYGYGLTHQEAACRLIVASKLGDEVDIPDELMGDA